MPDRSRLVPNRILATEFTEIFEMGLKFSIFSFPSVAFSFRFLIDDDFFFIKSIGFGHRLFIGGHQDP